MNDRRETSLWCRDDLMKPSPSYVLSCIENKHFLSYQLDVDARIQKRLVQEMYQTCIEFATAFTCTGHQTRDGMTNTNKLTLNSVQMYYRCWSDANVLLFAVLPVAMYKSSLSVCFSLLPYFAGNISIATMIVCERRRQQRCRRRRQRRERWWW